MKPDELHALADALEPMAQAPRFVGRDIPAFCAYLRACADAKPLTAMDVDDWAEMHRLRAEVKGPDGYATWKDAAVAERVRRVKAERQLSERQSASEPTEVQIKARDALLDFISENGTASEGVQHYLDRYVRAALAAKEQPE